MKKILALILVATTLLFCVSACTSSTASSSASGSAATTSPSGSAGTASTGSAGTASTGSAATGTQATGTSATKPDPISLADFYIYDSKGQKIEHAELSHISTLDKDHATFRGVKAGDKVTVLADKYDLSEFMVRVLGEDSPEKVATKENIVIGKGSLHISTRMDVGGVNNLSYFLSFTVVDDEIFMVSVSAIGVDAEGNAYTVK